MWFSDNNSTFKTTWLLRATICPLTVFKSLCYPSCSCLYRTKLINVVNKCAKKVKVEKSEAIVEQNVNVWVLNIHIWSPNVHVWVLKNSGYNLTSSFVTKIGLDSYFWHPLYIHACSARLVSFEIKFKFINLKRN